MECAKGEIRRIHVNHTFENPEGAWAQTRRRLASHIGDSICINGYAIKQRQNQIGFVAFGKLRQLINGLNAYENTTKKARGQVKF